MHRTPHPPGQSREAPPLGELVAAEIRAELARQRVLASVLSERLGKPRSWVDRRLSGSVLTVDDVHLIATELGVDARDLIVRGVR